MTKPLVLFLALLLTAPALAQEAPDSTQREVTDAHFAIYAADGERVPLERLVAAFRRADVVVLGEQHDDAVAHALQLRLLEAAAGLGRTVVLSLEMFERDVQPVLDEYLAGLIRERDFLAAARPWGNYATDYRPLVEFARERGIPVVAANAPGRYVNRVSRLGPEALVALPEAARATLPPLPVAPASGALAQKFEALMSGMFGHSADSTAAPVHGSAPSLANLLAAQNLRDAAMGHAIAEALMRRPDALVLHVNGTFHSEGGLGVPEHLRRYRPGTRVLTITMKRDDAFPSRSAGTFDPAVDFVVVTHPAGLGDAQDEG